MASNFFVDGRPIGVADLVVLTPLDPTPKKSIPKFITSIEWHLERIPLDQEALGVLSLTNVPAVPQPSFTVVTSDGTEATFHNSRIRRKGDSEYEIDYDSFTVVRRLRLKGRALRLHRRWRRRFVAKDCRERWRFILKGMRKWRRRPLQDLVITGPDGRQYREGRDYKPAFRRDGLLVVRSPRGRIPEDATVKVSYSYTYDPEVGK